MKTREPLNHLARRVAQERNATLVIVEVLKLPDGSWSGETAFVGDDRGADRVELLAIVRAALENMLAEGFDKKRTVAAIRVTLDRVVFENE